MYRTDFCLSFYLFYFVLPPFIENGLPFWVPGVLCQCSEAVLWNLLSVQMIFQWICQGESGLPVLLLHHLRTTPQETQVLNDTLEEMDLIDIFRTFHPNAEEYIFFSSAHGTFSRIDHILGHKSNLSKFKEIEIISRSYQASALTTVLWD